MDCAERAFCKALEPTRALSGLAKAELPIVPDIAGRAGAGPSPAPVLTIGTVLSDKIASGREVTVDNEDRLAASMPPSFAMVRFRTVLLSSMLIVVFGLASGWFLRSYVYPSENDGSSATAATTTSPSIDRPPDKTANGKIRTASRELSIEARALLDTIAESESSYSDRDPYRAIYGGRKAQSLTDHPREYVQIVTGPNVGQKTSAAGRYQYLERSWDEASKALKLSDFSPANQDRAAFWDAQRLYQAKTGRSLVAAICEAGQDPKKLEAIGRVISSWWTSLPGGIEPNDATASFGERFAENLLYYKRSPRTAAALDDARRRRRASKNARMLPVSLSAGPPAPSATTVSDITGEIQLAALLASAGPPSPQTIQSAKPDEVMTDSRAGHAGRSEFTNSVPLPKRRRSHRIPTRKFENGAVLSTLSLVTPETRLARQQGWTVSNVIDGQAVLKSGNKILRVRKGDEVPGAGRVAKILRWGNQWLVATGGGLISMQ